MTQNNDEDLLREAFHELRRDERRRAAVPDFEAMMSRARSEAAAGAPDRDEVGAGADVRIEATRRADSPAPPGIFARPESWLSLAAAAAIAMLMFANPSHADREFERLVTSYSTDAASGAWRSPTDALLRTPGVDLGAVPSFGGSMGGLGSPPEGIAHDDAGRDS